ncbi:MAG: sensor domain-containing protein, partial [Mycobacterium sp.]
MPAGRGPDNSYRGQPPGPFPGMAAPGGWGPGGPPPRPSRRRWWLLGAMALLAIIAVTVAIVIVTRQGNSAGRHVSANATTTSSTTTPAAVPPVKISALDGLLPSPADVASAVSAPPLLSRIKPEQSHAFYSDHVVDNDCVGVVYAATQVFFEGSGWVSMRKQALADNLDNNAYKFSVTEAVVAFQDADAAMKFYHRASGVFHKCANRNVNARQLDPPDGDQMFMAVGPIAENDGILSTSMLSEG